MSTVAYTDTVVDVGAVDVNVNTAGLSNTQFRSATTTSQKLSGEGIGTPWELSFALSTNIGTGAGLVAGGDIIREQSLTQSAFEQLWAEANAGTASVLGGTPRLQETSASWGSSGTAGQRGQPRWRCWTV